MAKTDMSKEKAAGAAVKAALDGNPRLLRFLRALVRAVSEADGSVFLAGGYLRDVVDGRPGADVDVMIAGLSDRRIAKALLAMPRGRMGIRDSVAAGKHFPVLRLSARWSSRYIDIASARGGDSGAHPFVRALSDAARRDFTINSMLYELIPGEEGLRGELIDAFGGIADIARRTIRCVGSPEERLREDPVRVLRAIRMKNERKGYRVAPDTWRALRRLGPKLLPAVPADRVVVELLRSLQADAAGTLEDLRRTGILRALLPELSGKRSGTARSRRRFETIARSRDRKPLPPEILLANLLLDLDPGVAEAAARRLRFPNLRRILQAVSGVRALTNPRSMRYPLAETERILARQPAPRPFIALYRAAVSCKGGRPKDLARFLVRCAKTPFLVGGADLGKAGLPEGPQREETLLAVREATLSGKVRTREEARNLLRAR